MAGQGQVDQKVTKPYTRPEQQQNTKNLIQTKEPTKEDNNYQLEKERERVCMCVWERKRESVSVSERVREKERKW